MNRQEWERVARKQLGVDPDATIPAPAPAAGSILEGLTLEQLERLAASNRDRGIRISPELRAMLERRRLEYGGPNVNPISNPDGV